MNQMEQTTGYLKTNWMENEHYRFRLAEKSDFQEILQLFGDAIERLDAQKIYQWDEIYPNAETLSEDIQKRQMYCLTQDGEVLSAVVLNEEQDEEYQTADWSKQGGRPGVIHRLCVKAAEQGKNLGKKTVLFAQRELLRQGYDSVRLDAFSENPCALRLYESLSYRKTGVVQFRKGTFYLYEKLLHTQNEQ